MNGVHVVSDVVEGIASLPGGLPQAQAVKHDVAGDGAGFGRQGMHLKGDKLEKLVGHTFNDRHNLPLQLSCRPLIEPGQGGDGRALAQDLLDQQSFAAWQEFGESEQLVDLCPLDLAAAMGGGGDLTQSCGHGLAFPVRMVYVRYLTGA